MQYLKCLGKLTLRLGPMRVVHLLLKDQANCRSWNVFSGTCIHMWIIDVITKWRENLILLRFRIFISLVVMCSETLQLRLVYNKQTVTKTYFPLAETFSFLSDCEKCKRILRIFHPIFKAKCPNLITPLLCVTDWSRGESHDRKWTCDLFFLIGCKNVAITFSWAFCAE